MAVIRRGDTVPMDSLGVTWILAMMATMVVVLIITSAFRSRRRTQRRSQRDGVLWKRAYHLGSELAVGRNRNRNEPALVQLLETTDQPLLVASALAVVVRQTHHDVHESLFACVRRSRLADVLRQRLDDADPNTKVEALEIIEVLRVHVLLGDAAVLTHGSDPLVVRAACDAVVELEPGIGIGILIGMANGGDSWVLDSLGRAVEAAARRESTPVPLSRSQWRSAPMLAQRALSESATFSSATVTDALMALVEALEHSTTSKRLAAVTALSASIDHPAAQIALAGALGADDRMVRFATAANLADSPQGRDILRRVALSGDGSDAARMAADVLWTTDDPALAGARADGLRVVAS
jgi:hypothetical protein